MDQAGNAYVTGITTRRGPTFRAPRVVSSRAPLAAASDDAFVAKISAHSPPVCSAAQANPAALWSPNHQFVPIAMTGVTDPDGNAVTITVTGVTQDEPVNAKGDGNTSPGCGDPGRCRIGASRTIGERQRPRLSISFKADNGQGRLLHRRGQGQRPP